MSIYKNVSNNAVCVNRKNSQILTIMIVYPGFGKIYYLTKEEHHE